MRKRLFIYTTLILLAGLLCFFSATLYSAGRNNRIIAEDTAMETAQIIAALYSSGYHFDNLPLDAFAETGSDTRITIISRDGTVLADSRPIDLDTLEAHLDRPEIQAAASGEPAAFTRHSSTLGVDLIYYALKVDIPSADGTNDYVFVRTAIPFARVNAYLTASLPLLILTFIVIIALCFALSRRVIDRLLQPLESVKQMLSLLHEGENKPAALTGGYEEIDAIVREIDDVAQVLQESMKALRDEKNKAEYILNNIGDAIFAVNGDYDIALINNAAQSIFDVTPELIGKSINYLTYYKPLRSAIDDCFDTGKSSLSELSYRGRTYLLTIKPLEDTNLKMVILSDITDSRENSRRREEFFENASHELKTPLTAIKGFNELCAMGNKDGDLKKYIDAITRETDRMLVLIGDMLKLSELSSGPQKLKPVPVRLHALAVEIQGTLSAAIKEKGISFAVAGECMVMSEQEHIFELMKNLIENAVRYNVQGGSVVVSLDSDSLKVSDSGIGIAPEAQTRLFERFYRVEKSRSIQSGGTGLGLSIVKHICALYSWELTLRSKPGIGTDVTVVF